MAVLGWPWDGDGAALEPAGVGVLVLSGHVEPGDGAALASRLTDLMGDPPPPELVCDVAGLVSPDLEAVDALAQLRLGVRRLGSRLRLRGATPELRDLLRLTGLGMLLLDP